ncbi:MAG: hypothetical protein IID09_07870, partial [Candidatus Hydrogenedentes bacterium]|nr:hypothetical protein [Candidatus Hydrogenedentota bacterium]
MMLTKILAVVLAATMGAAFWAHADTITLKEAVYVKGPKVLLGDVAVIEGLEADSLRAIEIAPAAAPGSARRLNAALVRARIIEGGFDPSGVEVRGP